MFQIPDKNKRITQVNDGDVLGTMWSSFNLNLQDNKGRIRVSPRGMIVATSDDPNTANLKTPVCFNFFNDTSPRIWAIAGRMFNNHGDPGTTWSEDTSPDTPVVGSGSDMELFNGAMYVIGSNKIMKRSLLGVWSEIQTNEGTDFTTCCVAGTRLYYSFDQSKVKSISRADLISSPSGIPNSTQYTLQLADNGNGGSAANYITSIRASSNRVWIATMNADSNTKTGGRNGAIYEWDGSSTTTSRRYEVGSAGVLALVIKDDVPYAMDAEGRLLAFTGSSFTEIARLPVPKDGFLKNPLAEDPTLRYIHPRGIIVRDGKICVLINNEAVGTGAPIYENIPSGIWVFDERIGFYHESSASQWIFDETTTRTDFGQNRLRAVGAIFNAKTVSNSGITEGNMLFGARCYKNTSDSEYTVMMSGNTTEAVNVGYFVTTKIDASEIQDVWQKVYITHKKLLSSADRIILKYRTTDDDPTEATITWTSTTQFTSTDDLSDYAVGDEVEITLGTGGGQIEHIQAISVAGGTYTVTLENAVTGTNGTAKARFQHWKKISEQTNQNDQFKEFSLLDAPKSTWIQLKCVVYFTQKDEINELTLINQKQFPAK